MLPDASIILPCRNAESTVRQQLDALRQSPPGLTVEIIVVDNGSQDRTRAILDDWPDPRLRVIHAAGDSSVAFAKNQGAAAALGEVLLFCDADDVVAPGWIESMVDASRRFDVFGGPVETGMLSQLGGECPRLSLPRDLDWQPWLIGANVGVRAAAWERLGGFDEAYRAAEDVALSWQAHVAGLDVGIVPDALVHYRLRERRWAAARQGFHWGRWAPRLRCEFGMAGFRPRPMRGVVGDVLRLVSHPPVRKRCQVAWFRLSGLLLGRIVGSVQHRTRLL